MQIVFISGPSATGKTAIGKQLADRLGYVFISKDAIKEKLFDTERHTTLDFSWYESRAKNRFLQDVKQHLQANKSLIVESNFISRDKRRLAKLLQANDKVSLVEIYCSTRGLTNFKRFVKRNESGTRHRGHHDRQWYLPTLFQTLLACVGIIWPFKPLRFSNHLMTVDTTIFSNIDYDKIVEFIHSKGPDYL